MLKTHGKDGQVRVQVEDAYYDDLMKARAVFIDMDGSQVPFLIKEIEVKNHILMRLDELDQPEQASALSLKDIYLETSSVSEEAKNMILEEDHSLLLNYTVIDQNDAVLGKITEVIENDFQDLLEIKSKSTKFLWPFHPDLVIDQDDEKKILKIQLLEGFL